MRKTNLSFYENARVIGWFAMTLLCSLPGAVAQNVIEPVAGVPEQPVDIVSLKRLFNWGPVSLRPPTVNYSFTYGTGVQAQPGQPQDSIIQTYSAGIPFTIGTHWALMYSPSLTFYSNELFNTTFNHGVSLSGQTTYENWSFGLSQSYAPSSSALIETGRQTDSESFSTGLSAGYQINSKASLNFGFSQNIRSADKFNSSRDWAMTDGFNYQFSPQFGAGVSISAGYTDVNQGSDMTYEQLNGHVSWQPTDKLSASVSAGGEMRQFLDTEAQSLINPTFGATVSYKPVEVTTIYVSASRGVSASYFTNQVTESTSLSVGVQQRILKHFQLGVSGGYHTSTYVSANPGLATARDDSGFSLGASLGFGFLKRANFSAFYNYSENSSSQSDFAFASTQVGFSVGYAF